MISAATPFRRWLLPCASAALIALGTQGAWARPITQQGAAIGRAAPALRQAALPLRLLFFPTGSETVDIYDLQHPNHGALGVISSGLVGDQYQLTTDAAGDLFVVNDNFLNQSQEYVSVYAPPYTSAPAILNGVLFPIGVAVDAAGTVYVSNCGEYCNQSPAVYVYQHGSTTPTSAITSPALRSLGGLALDKAGNLYIPSSDRSTGASTVFRVQAGSSTPTDLHLKGLFNFGGPGTGTVAVNGAGDLFVGNNSNSEYVLAFKPHATTAYRIIDPFFFFDTPGTMTYGPDGKLYVPINCGSQSCEGSVIAFEPKHAQPAETIGPASAGVNGVATFPNLNFVGQNARTPEAYLRATAMHPSPAVRPQARGLTNYAAMTPRPAIGRPVFAARSRHVLARHGGGWIAAGAAQQHLMYMSESGNGSSSIGSVDIYPANGQGQAPIGVITDGIATPEGIGTDHAGNLYVANSGSSTVTVYKPGQKLASTTISNGLGLPYDVKVGADGTVYVANAFSTPSGTGSVTEYPAGSTNPSLTITHPGLSAVSLALDKSNNLYVAWYSLSGTFAEVDKYAPGSSNGTNLALDLPVPCFPLYAMAVDHGGNLVVWYESYDHSVKYLATFPPGATEPSRKMNGGSFLDIVSGIAFGRSKSAVYVSAINVNEGAKLMYPRGLPLDVIGLDHAQGIALSPGT